MHTIWMRLNAVIFFGLTVLLTLSIFAALSTITMTKAPVLEKLEINQFLFFKETRQNPARKGSHNEGYDYDQALFTFDVDIDLKPAFHWNTKQLFLMLIAEYESKKYGLSQIVIWDKIIERLDGLPVEGESERKTKVRDELKSKRRRQKEAEEARLARAQNKKKITDNNYRLTLKKEFLKYPLKDPSMELLGKNVTLKLLWDHMPLTGALYMSDRKPTEANSVVITMPDEYFSSTK